MSFVGAWFRLQLSGDSPAQVPDHIVAMVKSGILTLEQALILLRADGHHLSGENGEDRKRGHQVVSPSKDSDMASPAPKEAKGELDSLALIKYISIYNQYTHTHVAKNLMYIQMLCTNKNNQRRIYVKGYSWH